MHPAHHFPAAKVPFVALPHPAPSFLRLHCKPLHHYYYFRSALPLILLLVSLMPVGFANLRISSRVLAKDAGLVLLLHAAQNGCELV